MGDDLRVDSCTKLGVIHLGQSKESKDATRGLDT